MLRICLVCLVLVFWSTNGLPDISDPAAANVPVDVRVHLIPDDALSDANQIKPQLRSQPDSPQGINGNVDLPANLSGPVTAGVPVDLRLYRKPDDTQPDSRRHQPEFRSQLASPQDNARRRPQAARIRNKHPIQYSSGGKFYKSSNLTDTLNYPYMAAVMINGRLWCAGAIVDVGWVLTAAHCLNYVLSVLAVRTLNRYVKVRVGSVKPHEGGELVDVTGALRHPKFEEEPVPHADVALLKLQRDLEFSKFVNLIRIYDGSREPFAQSFVSVAGWGASSGAPTAFREPTPTMLVARLKVRTQHYCEDAYQLVNGFQFGEDMFCASLRNGTRDACLFDAGAPAVQHNALMGIMSFGPERCGGMQPAVFIKALYFRDFVKHTIVSYKTTSDLIDAVKEAESYPRAPMMN